MMTRGIIFDMWQYVISFRTTDSAVSDWTRLGICVRNADLTTFMNLWISVFQVKCITINTQLPVLSLVCKTPKHLTVFKSQLQSKYTPYTSRLLAILRVRHSVYYREQMTACWLSVVWSLHLDHSRFPWPELAKHLSFFKTTNKKILFFCALFHCSSLQHLISTATHLNTITH